MSCEVAISVDNLSKCYHIYDKPRERLLQMLAGRRKQYYREFWALRGVSFKVMRVPCHRIVRTEGSLSGYRWGVERKSELLQREQEGG